MSGQMIGKAAQQAGKAASDVAGKGVLQKGAKRDPELYILGGIMACAAGIGGFYFGRKPTSATSEEHVLHPKGGMPWQGETSDADTARADYKYQYHPGGDPKNPPKDAPSALHTVVVPGVNLPKELHEKYNKWGKDSL
ncbi:hypothetical protein BJ878DRAFT_523324 [Calycina marina]|uniref:Uncharacterized protein n=1 Tax=Calycina marina TaxID=1763456 RepID=A0A9P7YWC7_9HELO|nr:hypothetical protein BJ878DRAFT_523324 [Calycina marina]